MQTTDRTATFRGMVDVERMPVRSARPPADQDDAVSNTLEAPVIIGLVASVAIF